MSNDFGLATFREVYGKKYKAVTERLQVAGFRHCEKCGLWVAKDWFNDNGTCFDCNL